jgi:hypothetical protein
MPNASPVPRGGVAVVAATWAVAGVVHTGAALTGSGGSPALHYVLAAAALVGALVLGAGARRPEVLVVAAVVGVVGVAAFVVPLLLPLMGVGNAPGDVVAPWPLGAFVLDALTVRLAVFTLRRAGYNQDTRPTRNA